MVMSVIISLQEEFVRRVIFQVSRQWKTVTPFTGRNPSKNIAKLVIVFVRKHGFLLIK
jgi:hypothetical protein